MTKNIEVIIVPSASLEEDVERLHKAREYGTKLEREGKEVRYIDSGIGPDLNRRLRQENHPYNKYFLPFEGTNGLDVHPGLWNESLQNAKQDSERKKSHQVFGVDTVSVNRVQSVVYTFPKGTEGNYTFVARKFHNKRTEQLVNFAREENYLSNNLKISYVNTDHKYSIRELLHDAMSNVQTKLFGRKEIKEEIKKAQQ